jgi:hypothetical protein
MMQRAEIYAVYAGSNGEATKALYARLEALGTAGVVAVNLFRACKASERAKVYRGGGYRGAAYDKKQWSMDNLCAALERDGERLGIRWGWGIDDAMKGRGEPHHHVLYVDLPTGQVSFHSGSRGAGPDYPDRWDGLPGQSAGRICGWVEQLLAEGARA